MKKLKIVFVGATCAIMLAFLAFKLYAGKNVKQLAPVGLTLVAKYEPLHLYIFADTTSTNSTSAYLIAQGNEALFHREMIGSNIIETTHFEEGFSTLVVRRSTNGMIIERIAFNRDASNDLKYIYIDKTGGGMWDYFMDQAEKKYYSRSNLCWVLKN